MKTPFQLLLAGIFAATAAGYAQQNKTAPTARQPDRELYDRSMHFYAHKKYEQALIVLQTLINSWPESQYAEPAKQTMDDCWRLPECAIAHEQLDSSPHGGITFSPNPATGTLENLCDVSHTTEINLNTTHFTLSPGSGLNRQFLPVILYIPHQTIEAQGIKNAMDATATACDPDRTCDRERKARVQFERFNSKGAAGAYVIERSDGRKQTGTFKVRAKPVNICE